jgi:hypothetical protein
MKKNFVVLSFLSTLLILLAFSDSSSDVTNTLIGNTWKFKSIASENVSASHYLTTIYDGAQYRFSEDNTFTGSFFGLPMSGTWEVSNDILFLNKGTGKEEMYEYTIVYGKDLVLKGTEKGNKFLMTFASE